MGSFKQSFFNLVISAPGNAKFGLFRVFADASDRELRTFLESKVRLTH